MENEITIDSILTDYAERSGSPHDRWCFHIRPLLMGWPFCWMEELVLFSRGPRKGQIKKLVIKWDWEYMGDAHNYCNQSWDKLCTYLECPGGGWHQENNRDEWVDQSTRNISTVTLGPDYYTRNVGTNELPIIRRTQP